jgi:hypothetical protein
MMTIMVKKPKSSVSTRTKLQATGCSMNLLLVAIMFGDAHGAREQSSFEQVFGSNYAPSSRRQQLLGNDYAATRNVTRSEKALTEAIKSHNLKEITGDVLRYPVESILQFTGERLGSSTASPTSKRCVSLRKFTIDGPDPNGTYNATSFLDARKQHGCDFRGVHRPKNLRNRPIYIQHKDGFTHVLFERDVNAENVWSLQSFEKIVPRRFQRFRYARNGALLGLNGTGQCAAKWVNGCKITKQKVGPCYDLISNDEENLSDVAGNSFIFERAAAPNKLIVRPIWQ